MEPNTTQPNAAPRCQHIKDSSYPCGSPALRGKSFCYYHDRVHAPTPDPRKNPKAFTPHLESGESIQLFVTNVCRALGSGQLDVKQARTMISAVRALKFAFDLRNEHRGQPIADDLTPAMSNVLAESENCSTDSPVGDHRATTSSTAAVILSEDERPSEGSRQPVSEHEPVYDPHNKYFPSPVFDLP